MPDSTIDLEQTLRLMDVADAIRRQHRRVHAHLEQTDRQRIKEQISERYAAMGHAIDPKLLDEAIDIVLAQQHRFKEPKPGLGLRMAHLYVRRGELTRKIGVPLVLLAAAATAGVIGREAQQRKAAAHEERAAEEATVQLYRAQASLRSRAQRLASDAASAKLAPESTTRVREILESVSNRLDGAQAFLNVYAPQGDAELHVNPDNLTPVSSRVAALETELDDVRGLLAEGEQRVQQQASLGALRRQAESLHRGIRSSTREPDAVKQADGHWELATRNAEARDVAGLRQAVTALEDLKEQLDREYTVYILRGRERDRVRHYLIVQALDANGKPLRVKIRNEESGHVEEVLEWGERVPKRVYDRVAADYRDDNVINDNVFATKRRGDLEPERKFENLGQITEY